MLNGKYQKTDYLSPEEAFFSALEIVKGKFYSIEQVCVWRNRYNKGTLSHKKVQEVLEKAGFKRVVEEKWMMIRRGEETPSSEVLIDKGDGGDFSGIDYSDLPQAI